MFKTIVRNLPLIRHFLEINSHINSINKIEKDVSELIDLNKRLLEINIDNYINKNLHENKRYTDSKKLNQYEYQVYSQNGEDGIIAEIFKRIGVTNKFCVEFGAQNGLANNTTCLMLKDWTSAWIEARTDFIEQIESKFDIHIRNNKLALKKAFVTAENIESLFKELNVPEEFDLLSIDIDGNDYWVWKAIKNYSPRVVVIEYNAMLLPHDERIMKYNPDHVWKGTGYFGASLQSMEILGHTKGYKLVGCNFIGVNAFFVREDLVADQFLDPFTAENHYEPPRYYLQRHICHPKDFGEFKTI